MILPKVRDPRFVTIRRRTSRCAAACNGSEAVASLAGQFPAGRAGARPVILSLSSHNSRAAVSSRAAADGSRRWRLT